MFCHNCGTALDDGAKFCPNCGTPVLLTGSAPEPAAAFTEPTSTLEEPTGYTEPVQEPAEPANVQPEAPVYQQPEAPVYQQPEAPVVNEKANALATPCLIFGILGIVFSLTFYLSLFGIIFSAIGRGKVKAFLAAGGQLSGKAKVGNILSKLGLIFGIILFVFFITWLSVIIFGVVQKNYGSNIYWHF